MTAETLAGPETTNRLEIVAGGAVADVELVADDRKPHGVGAEQQLAVFDGVEARVVGNVRRPAAVPADAVTIFGSVHTSQVLRLKSQAR